MGSTKILGQQHFWTNNLGGPTFLESNVVEVPKRNKVKALWERDILQKTNSRSAKGILVTAKGNRMENEKIVNIVIEGKSAGTSLLNI